MKIRIEREIEVPDKLICHHGRCRECYALTQMHDTPSEFRRCAYFGSYVKWSDKAGFFVKCDDCIKATMDYLRR